MKRFFYTIAALSLAATAAYAARIRLMHVEKTDGSAGIELEVRNAKELNLIEAGDSYSLSVEKTDGSAAQEINLKDVKQISFSSYIDPTVVAAPPAKYGNYLNEYEPLKNYVDRTTGKVNPDFKLGIAIEQFQVNNASVFNMVAESFDEFTLGNEMKYASVVRGSDGSMDFNTVKNMVAKAKEKGLTIYGHTLAWHSQQNIQYLTSVMKDKEDPTPEKVEEERTCFQVRAADKKSDPWDSQVWFVFDEADAFKGGETWEVSMDVKAARQATAGTQIHKAPSEYLHYNAIGNIDFSPEWKTVKLSGKIDSQAAGGYSIAFNLNDFAKANIYFFDNVSFKLNGKELIVNGSCDAAENKSFRIKEDQGSLVAPEMLKKISYERINTIPLTKEERAGALADAMDRWIEGMMEATDGYVTTWDVVNEAIGGGAKNKEGFYELQHANNVDNNGVSGDNFFWQDVMGDTAYVRTAVASARKHFKGDPEDLLLFVNDYNLESWWDQNLKVKSMVDWIRRWEEDGVTKIDGIGTQMHISFMNNENDMKTQKDAIVNMFKILAASGKLIKITELDMGYVPQMWGTSKKSKELTAAQHKQMADFYQFIVEKYFEIIPVEQQYGITWWCLGDSPEGSGWRAGEPVGLLDQNNKRKEAYAGVADGLYNASKK